MIKEGTTSLERTKRMLETLRTIYGRSKTASQTKGQKLRDFEKKVGIRSLLLQSAGHAGTCLSSSHTGLIPRVVQSTL